MARTTETTEDGEEYVTPGKVIEMVVDGPQVYIVESCRVLERHGWG